MAWPSHGRWYNSSRVRGTPLNPTINLGAHFFFLPLNAQQKTFKVSPPLPADNLRILSPFIIIEFLSFHSFVSIFYRAISSTYLESLF